MSRSSSFAGAAIVPGMPQVLASQQHPDWAALAEGMTQVADDIETARPDVLVILSTQWFTVLGYQFQMDPNPRGSHVDENWYDFDYGRLSYSFDVDVDFSEEWAVQTEASGFQSRRTLYDDFPIDTGTIVAQQILNNDSRIPSALVSCNLYAAATDLGHIAAAGLRAAEILDKRAYFIAVSGLSSGLTQRWIAPDEDRVESTQFEEWDRRMLGLLVEGRLDEALGLREEYAREAQADSQFRALAFLAGTDQLDQPADLLAYGPLWGTGGAVVRWRA